MTAKIIFCGAVIAALAWPSRDEVEKWAILIFGISLSALPVAKRWVLEVISWSKASRDARRKDCTEELKRERAENRALKRRNEELNREVVDWKRRYDAGTGDHPRME